MKVRLNDNPSLEKQESMPFGPKHTYSIDNIDQNPFNTPMGSSSILRSKPKQEENPNLNQDNQLDETNNNPYLIDTNTNNNNDGGNNLFKEPSQIKKENNNDNPFGNDNLETNSPFGEGFNKSLAQSITNPYADNVNNNVHNSMQGSIVDDVKFKDKIPEFKDDVATNDFPKSE